MLCQSQSEKTCSRSHFFKKTEVPQKLYLADSLSSLTPSFCVFREISVWISRSSLSLTIFQENHKNLMREFPLSPFFLFFIPAKGVSLRNSLLLFEIIAVCFLVTSRQSLVEKKTDSKTDREEDTPSTSSCSYRNSSSPVFFSLQTRSSVYVLFSFCLCLTDFPAPFTQYIMNLSCFWFLSFFGFSCCFVVCVAWDEVREGTCLGGRDTSCFSLQSREEGRRTCLLSAVETDESLVTCPVLSWADIKNSILFCERVVHLWGKYGESGWVVSMKWRMPVVHLFSNIEPSPEFWEKEDSSSFIHFSNTTTFWELSQSHSLWENFALHHQVLASTTSLQNHLSLCYSRLCIIDSSSFCLLSHPLLFPSSLLVLPFIFVIISLLHRKEEEEKIYHHPSIFFFFILDSQQIFLSRCKKSHHWKKIKPVYNDFIGERNQAFLVNDDIAIQETNDSGRRLKYPFLHCKNYGAFQTRYSWQVSVPLIPFKK